MNVVHAQVRHPSFGLGAVKSQSETIVEVDFSGEIKRFVYPAAFEKYLALEKPALRNRMEVELHTLRLQGVEARKEREAEAARLRDAAEKERAEQKRAMSRRKPAAGEKKK
ncbi:hypothetical protein LJC32_05730 [Oscillospiraceae bacterium OttesenSCG-928-F05]|nr:hypothetical protein [Oscillospiraceae bacterium OttesenSCG-928-F05]